MKKHLPSIIAVLVVGIIAFYGGIKFGESKSLQANTLGGIPSLNGQSTAQFRQNSGQFPGQMSGQAGSLRRNGQNGNLLNGEILEKDDTSMTVKLNGGGSKIVFYSDTTKVMKSVDIKAADLAVGEKVMVNGTANSDGSLTATNIQIRPNMPFGSQEIR